MYTDIIVERNEKNATPPNNTVKWEKSFIIINIR